MANYNTLKSSISSSVRTNGSNAITGAILQNVLNTMVNSLGAKYQFVGVATTDMNPGTPDYNVAYLAGPGTYANFGGATIAAGKLGVLKYNGSWTVETINLPAGTIVAWSQIVNSGTKIATITINGTPTDVYAPSGGGASIDPKALLTVQPTIKILNKNRNAPSGEGEVVIINHPLLDLGEACDIVLMVRRPKNKSRAKNKRKGWFEARGKTPQSSAVIDSFASPNGESFVTQLDIKNIIAANYCRMSDKYSGWYPIYDGGPSSWMDEVASHLYSFPNTILGFSGSNDFSNLKRTITFGIAIRVTNPAFTALLTPGAPLKDNTGSINGVKRYFYSKPAPIIAYVAQDGQEPDAGTITLSPLP